MFTFEIAVPTKDKASVEQIMRSAGYTPHSGKNKDGIFTIEVQLDKTGEKGFLLKKLKNADVYYEVLREEKADSRIKKIKKMIATISKNKKADNEWSEWESKYDFSFSEADSYDLANATAKAKKILKKYDLKEAKLTESIVDQIMSIPDPYDRYSKIYTGITSGKISYEEFSEIMEALFQSEEDFSYIYE